MPLIPDGKADLEGQGEMHGQRQDGRLGLGEVNRP
jgi:hypothetical protein